MFSWTIWTSFFKKIHHILVVSMMKTLVLDFTVIVMSWVA